MGREADRLVVRDAAVGVVDWPVPANDDGDFPAAVARQLVAALLVCGRLAFRWDASPPPGESRPHPEPPRSILQIAKRAFGSPSALTFGVLETSDPAVALSLFDYGGWAQGSQAVLAFDPALQNTSSLVAALQGGIDWRKRTLPHGARLLFGPGHDGAFAVVAAAGLEQLDQFARALGS